MKKFYQLIYRADSVEELQQVENLLKANGVSTDDDEATDVPTRTAYLPGNRVVQVPVNQPLSGDPRGLPGHVAQMVPGPTPHPGFASNNGPMATGQASHSSHEQTAHQTVRPGVVQHYVPVLEVDESGTPWDKRIHSASKLKTGKELWKKKKGVDDIQFHKIAAELRAGLTPQHQAPQIPPPAPTQEVVRQVEYPQQPISAQHGQPYVPGAQLPPTQGLTYINQNGIQQHPPQAVQNHNQAVNMGVGTPIQPNPFTQFQQPFHQQQQAPPAQTYAPQASVPQYVKPMYNLATFQSQLPAIISDLIGKQAITANWIAAKAQELGVNQLFEVMADQNKGNYLFNSMINEGVIGLAQY